MRVVYIALCADDDAAVVLREPRVHGDREAADRHGRRPQLLRQECKSHIASCCLRRVVSVAVVASRR